MITNPTLPINKDTAFNTANPRNAQGMFKAIII